MKLLMSIPPFSKISFEKDVPVINKNNLKHNKKAQKNVEKRSTFYDKSNNISTIKRLWSFTSSLYKKKIKEIRSTSSKKSLIPKISKTGLEEL